MVSGTLYTYPGNYRAHKIQIAAAYSGADVKIASDFEFGKTNTNDDFLQKFPMGKVPAFKDSNGVCLSEPNAICHYVSNEALNGTNPVDQALVLQYLEFADTEILPSACTWVYPTLGFKQYNKQDTEKAQAHLKKCLALLDGLLESRTFLVGERISLADIGLCCNMLMLYAQVMDGKFREPYGNVNRWFLTCINQPKFKEVLGDFKLCEKMATFDNKRYQELHPKDNKKGGKEQKPKQEKQEKKPKEEKPKPAEVEEPAPKPKKVDHFAHLPATEFVLDTWKRFYSNNEPAATNEYLWKNFDPNAWSWWFCNYQYNYEHRVGFMTSNAVGGMFHRLECLRKHLFGNVVIFNEKITNPSNPKEVGNFSVSGVFLCRGVDFIFKLEEDWYNDAEYYDWRKLDPLNNSLDKSCVESYLHADFSGEYDEGRKGLEIYNSSAFK